MKPMLLLCLAACLLIANAEAGRIVYRVFRGRYSWPTVRAKCSQLGKGWTLPMPKKEGQNNVITNLANSKTPPAVPFWIGLHDIVGREGIFWWNDGKRLGRKSWKNWATNEPNNGDGHDDCVQVNSSGEWSVDRCDVAMAFICQKKMP